MTGDTLSERYERTMWRLEQITQAGYQIKVQWDCEFDDARIVNQKPELLRHPILGQSRIHTPMLYMGVEPKHCVSTIKHARMRPSNMFT